MRYIAKGGIPVLMLYTAMIDDEADKLRFEDIYYTYRKQMIYVANQVLRDPEDAEDAVQNALLAIARNIKTVPAGNPKVVKAYVLVAAKNAALNMLPQKQRRETQVDIDELQMAGEDDLFRRVAASQDYEMLMRAMSKLPELYREVLMLRFVHEQTENQIAQLLGRKRITVHQQITRGKQALTVLCRKEGMDLGEEAD